jgi:hypothetical protein
MNLWTCGYVAEIHRGKLDINELDYNEEQGDEQELEQEQAQGQEQEQVLSDVSEHSFPAC